MWTSLTNHQAFHTKEQKDWSLVNRELSPRNVTSTLKWFLYFRCPHIRVCFLGRLFHLMKLYLLLMSVTLYLQGFEGVLVVDGDVPQSSSFNYEVVCSPLITCVSSFFWACPRRESQKFNSRMSLSSSATLHAQKIILSLFVDISPYYFLLFWKLRLIQKLDGSWTDQKWSPF